MAEFTEKADEIAKRLNNWALRERVFAMEYASYERAERLTGRKPLLTFEFSKALKARRLILTQPLQRREDIKKIGVIRAVEVTWNKSKKPLRIEMNSNPLAPTVYELERPRSLRSMTLRVVSRMGKKGKKNLPVGFAEIVLGGSKLK